ncbi:sulfotransferase [Coleofasciculus chthonoplastes]|uniref:sulfotransferase n=1 Tax=Coleofasciculus chthonoplastes TaxID=64178 RepID=UPI0032F6B826
MIMPNFLIIGAAKAGTTSLYSYLNQHPQVYMSPVKEPRFFTPELYSIYNNGVRDNGRRTALTLEQYGQLFQGVSTEIAIGEASTEYLYIPKAPERIKSHIPKAKLIAILRNPVERAFSAFLYQFRDGVETLTFQQALQAEEKRIKAGFRPGWHYKQVGFYSSQVKRYLDGFDPEQMRLYLYDDLSSDGLIVVQDIYRFLAIDDTFIPDFKRENVSGIPKRRWLQNLFTKNNPLKSAFKPLFSGKLRLAIRERVKKQNLGAKPILSPEIRQELIEVYREDIEKLQTLIQRDLSAWLA